MFRGGGDKTSNELPVDGAVRVRKVERIQAYNLVTKPSGLGPTATARPAESLAVRVVRVGDVDDNTDSFVSVAIARTCFPKQPESNTLEQFLRNLRFPPNSFGLFKQLPVLR